MNYQTREKAILDIIRRGLADKNGRVRKVALKACNRRRIPLDIISEWLADENRYVRQAAPDTAIRASRACTSRWGAIPKRRRWN